MSSHSSEKGNRPAGNLFADLLESRDDLIRLIGGKQSYLGQHPGVGHGARDILLVESLIEADTLREAFHSAVRGFPKYSTPGFF
ncbi:MAG: hypothetical protein KatS3mg112_1456 [Thermogutta sp.]|nr:MAG: hypothetical protein KatS3mg112_1456 [Thermogutta sp.]